MSPFKIQKTFHPNVTTLSRMSVNISESYAESIGLLTKLESADIIEHGYRSLNEEDENILSIETKAGDWTKLNGLQKSNETAYNPIRRMNDKSIEVKRSSLIIEELQERMPILSAQLHYQFYADVLRGSESGKMESHSRAQLLQQVNQREGNRSTIRSFRLALESLIEDCMKSPSSKQAFREIDGIETRPLVDSQSLACRSWTHYHEE
jgi:hypothetical protein